MQGVEIDVKEIVKIVVEHLENDKGVNGIDKGEYVLVQGCVCKNRLLDDFVAKQERFIKIKGEG